MSTIDQAQQQPTWAKAQVDGRYAKSQPALTERLERKRLTSATAGTGKSSGRTPRDVQISAGGTRLLELRAQHRAKRNS